MHGLWPVHWTNPSRMWARAKQSRANLLNNMTITWNNFTHKWSAPPLLWRLVVLCGCCVWQTNCFAQDNAFTGQWQGVWHIGMSSGKVMLKLNDQSQGVIAFTNMPGFGNGENVLQKSTVESQSLMLSVQSERSNILTARLQLKPGGHTLEGMGQYAGAGVKLELHKTE